MFSLYLPERLAKAQDDFRLWAAKEPIAFFGILGAIIYLLFFYKRGQEIQRDWLPFEQMFNKFEDSPDAMERAHYHDITDNYEIDRNGGGVIAVDATTENGLFCVFYKRKDMAKDKDAYLQRLSIYDLKRLPNPVGANRIRMDNEKGMAFALMGASDLPNLVFKINGMSDADIGKQITRKALEEGYTEEALLSYTGRQGGLASQQGLLQR